MKFTLVAAMLVVGVQVGVGFVLRGEMHETATCNPTTKVCFAITENAVSTPQYECTPAASGAMVSINPLASKYGAIICGPGKFLFSPMTCAGGRFEYKQNVVEVDKSSWSGGSDCPGSGSKVDFPYNMSCYTVEC